MLTFAMAGNFLLSNVGWLVFLEICARVAFGPVPCLAFWSLWGRLGMVGLMHYSVLGPTPFCSGKTKTGMVQFLAWVLPAYAGCLAFCCAAASGSGARGAPSYRSETSTTAGDSSSVSSPACPCVSFLPSGLLYVPAPSHCSLYTWHLCNDAQGQPHVAADCWRGTGGALPQLFLSYSRRGKSNAFASP